MDEMEFDRTRKAIGSEALEEEERKRLLGAFTSSGGKVLDEKALRRQQAEAKRSGKEAPSEGRSSSVSDVKLPSELRKEQRARELERQALERKRKDAMRRESSSFFARLGIKIRCSIAGLTPFGSAMVQPAALSFFSLELRKALIECNILGNELLVNDAEVARTMKKELKNPFYIELVNRARLLYDRQELSELLASYSEANPRPVPLESMRVPLFSLLRKLYALMPYRESYLKSVQTGIMIQQKQQKKAANLYVAKQKGIEASWRLLMDKAFPKILLLVQRLEMKNIGPGHPLFEEMIGFGADLRVQVPQGGVSVEPAPADAAAEGGASVEATEQPDEPVSPEEQAKKEKERKKHELAQRLFEFGLGLHRRRTPEQLREAYDSKNEYVLADLHDKAFLSYLLLKFFDDQFAFILTTNRLQLEPIVQSGVRVNLKQDLTDAYQNIRSCHDMFRAYYHDYVEYRKALDEGSKTGNYVEHAKKVSMFETRRGKTGREVRMAIKNYMNRIEKLLAVLLKDMKEGGRVVLNPNDVFVMDLEADQSKIMNGRKMKEIIRDTYAFAHVLGRRLENGDLYGGVLELSEEDFQSSTKDSTAPAPPPEEDASSSDSGSDSDSQKGSEAF
jgi:hypothetical protein